MRNKHHNVYKWIKLVKHENGGWIAFLNFLKKLFRKLGLTKNKQRIHWTQELLEENVTSSFFQSMINVQYKCDYVV